MNYKARAFLGFLAMLLLLAAAFVIGAYKAFNTERMQVELAGSGLSDVLGSRVEMGNNLLTVARRHPQADAALLEAVENDIRALGAGTLQDKASANQRLSRDSSALLKNLEGLQSVQADSRDLSYVTGLLPRGLAQSAQWADAERYNSAASQFNQRLGGGLNGWVARLLGIRPAELFSEGGAQ